MQVQYEELEVVALSDHEWRVSDPRITERDARRILAYVEDLGDYVMVMWLSPGDGWAAFPSKKDAFEALRRTTMMRVVAA